MTLIDIMLKRRSTRKFNSEKITKGELEFYLESIKNQLSDTELSVDWQTEIEGEKAIDVAKQRALEVAVFNIEYCKVAQANGIKLTDKDKNDIDLMKKQFITKCGGDEAYKDFFIVDKEAK